jgi:hypothetical protein
MLFRLLSRCGVIVINLWSLDVLHVPERFSRDESESKNK